MSGRALGRQYQQPDAEGAEVTQKTRILRQFMYNMDEIEAMEMVLKSMKATKTNVEFFDMMRRGG